MASELDNAFSVRRGLSLDDKVGLFALDINPSVSGWDAPVGSVAMYTADGSVWRKVAAGTTAWANMDPKGNIAGTDPTVSDDNTQGYSARSIWINSTSGEAFMCLSAATGAADWRSLTEANIGSGLVQQAFVGGNEGVQNTANTAIAYNNAAVTLAAGDFILWWSLELSGLSNKGAGASVTFDGVQRGNCIFESQGTSLYNTFSGLANLPGLTAGNHTLRSDFFTSGGGNNVFIRRLRLEMLKVS